MATVLDAALAAHDAGISVMPIKHKKVPAYKWGAYQVTPASRDQVTRWFGSMRYTGLGAICGKVSGSLECLDYDEVDFDQFVARAEEWGLGPLLARVRTGYEARTPSGGRHHLYRCEIVGGSQKLAERPVDDPSRPDDKTDVLIETRGEGGYLVAPPSNGRVHENGGRWEFVSGGFSTIATITPEEREDLFALARSFDEMPEKEQRQTAGAEAPSADGRFSKFDTTAASHPGQDFRARHSTLETFFPIIEKHGWKKDHELEGAGYYTRPGKPSGTSASFNFKGNGLFKVFSTSAGFDTQHAHNPASVYCQLNHGGDWDATVKDLRSQGYGTPGPIPKVGGKATTGGAQANSNPSDDPIAWPDCKELPPVVTVPTMPPELIPAPLRTWMSDIAEIARLPLEMIAAPAIVGLGSVVGRSVGIRPWTTTTSRSCRTSGAASSLARAG
jgi:putative DNA primase/helicase